jgi:predicted peptidase
MYNTFLANPNLFAAQITTAYEPYHVFGDAKLGEDNYARIMDDMPTWLFAGLTDGSGVGCLGENDTRLKGERLRDIGEVMIRRGYKIDIAYGRNGELMWNGLLRGLDAEAVARAQIDRANAAGAKHLITLYIPGTILQTMHWSWNATYSNAEVRSWLFAQRNDNPALR